MDGQKETHDRARRLALTVSPDQAGRTVDSLLRRELGLSGTVIRRVKWLEDGLLLDGERVFTSRRVLLGETLSVQLEDVPGRSGIVAAPGAVDIVYEDGDLLVVNKAPGVPVHPGPGHWDDTLGNHLLDYYRRTGVRADFHPVHRLDKGTSGLMVVAKHPHAQEKMKAQLHSGAFHRVYLAVCCGVPQPRAGTVDAPIGRAEGSLLRREVRPDGAAARTTYEVLSVWGELALVRLVLDTGRTHQIRVHMAHLGCPLAGDFLYGTEDKALIGRAALHSAELALTQPITGEKLHFEAPLPEDIGRLLVSLPGAPAGARPCPSGPGAVAAWPRTPGFSAPDTAGPGPR